jgi:hypothetical protein
MIADRTGPVSERAAMRGREADRGAGGGAAILALLGGCLAAAGCTPTPPPVAPAIGCFFHGAPAGTGYAMDCAVGATLPDVHVDPVRGPGCSLDSLRLSGQTMTVPIAVVYGDRDDDRPGRVRLGATIAGARHAATLARSSGIDCAGTAPPAVPVETRFGGRHVALIDKDQYPMCVFESRLDLDPFVQAIGPGLGVDAAAAVRASLRDALARRLDFELASAVNHLHLPDANLESAFRTRSGRCPGDWREFTGE